MRPVITWAFAQKCQMNNTTTIRLRSADLVGRSGNPREFELGDEELLNTVVAMVGNFRNPGASWEVCPVWSTITASAPLPPRRHPLRHL
jgi:hypothetical protein